VLCGCPVAVLESEIRSLHPVAVDALVLARVRTLTGACVDDATALVEKVVRRVDGYGLAPSTVEALFSYLPRPALLRALHRLSDSPMMGLRHLLERLSPRDVLPLIAEVRDKKRPPFAFTTNASGFLGLLFALATDTADRSVSNLHRSSTTETVLMFGAARHTESLLVDMHRVRLVRTLVLNPDPSALAWTLKNPYLDRVSRGFVVSLSDPVVMLDLFRIGVLDVPDLVSWASARNREESPAVAASVFLLERPVQEVTDLALSVLRFSADPAGFLGILPPAGRRRVIEVLTGSYSAPLEETFFSLLGDWSGTVDELLGASCRLLGD